MSSITKRVHGPALVSNAAATKYTIPTGMRGEVTHLHVINPVAAATQATFTWSIGADAAGTRILDARPLAPGEEYNDYGPYTLEATEVIQALSGTNNQLVLTIDMKLTLLTA